MRAKERERYRRAEREEGRRQREEPSKRKMTRVIRLSPSSFSASFTYPQHSRRGAAVLPSGRFTYKFNKHISYLMHALSRECFDRPGPPSSSSTRVSSSRSLPRIPHTHARAQPSLYFLLFFSPLDCTACRKYTAGCLARDCLFQSNRKALAVRQLSSFMHTDRRRRAQGTRGKRIDFFSVTVGTIMAEFSSSCIWVRCGAGKSIRRRKDARKQADTTRAFIQSRFYD